jgi:hypothetical protein
MLGSMDGKRPPRRNIGLICSIVLAGSVIAGCHHRPRREMRQASADILAARRVQADIYAPASFEEARRALADAERMANKRKFEEARLLALTSSALAKSAMTLSGENREKMLAALKLQIESVAQKIAEGERGIQDAQRKPIDSKRAELFRSDLFDARAKLDLARQALARGDLVGGRRSVDSADIAAESLLREVRLTLAEEPVSQPRRNKRSDKSHA